MEIIKRKDNLGDHEFWFDNDSWVRVTRTKNVMSSNLTRTMAKPILRECWSLARMVILWRDLTDVTNCRKKW